jgi:cell division protein FtsW
VTRLQRQRHQMDYVLFFTVLILTAVGVLTVYSASTVIALQSDLPASYYAIRQLIFAVIGIVLMIGVSFLPHKFWYRVAVPFMGCSLLLLLLVLFIGHETLGGRRWLGAGSVLIQPSEIAIIAAVVYLSFFFTKQVTLIHSFKRGLLPGLIVVGLAFALIIAEPDMGTAMSLLTTCIVILFASGARLKPLLMLGGALLPVVIGLGFMESYRSARIKAWLDPFHSSQAYQLLHGFTAMAAGGWFGRGFDMSIQKMGYLPVPQIDFIFPVFVEEWGFVGAIALLATFAVLIWRGFHTARHAPDRFSALLSIGLTGMITFKTIINLGAVTGLLPVTGIPLPFISYGGTSLLMNLVAMGMLLSVSRASVAEEPEVDQLADVIYVEDVEQRRGKRLGQASDVPPLSVVSERRRADVRPLYQRRQQKADRTGSWRARQEVAATRRETPTIRPSSVPMTWRERHQAANRPVSDKDGGKSRRKSLFRKD